MRIKKAKYRPDAISW